MSRIEATFASLQPLGELALMPYLTLGYPSLHASLRLARALVEAGADALELGIPFSDPVADGITLQHAHSHALEGGTSTRPALEALAEARASVTAPLIVMTYYNPVLALGEREFVAALAGTGVDGLLVVDLPIEDASALRALCRSSGIDPIYMVTPSSSDARISQASRVGGGFLYCVSLRGVTGQRASLDAELPAFIARVRRQARLPLCVGFGVSTRQHVRAMRSLADGVIVGSALVERIKGAPQGLEAEEAAAFVRALKAETRRPAGRRSASLTAS